MTEIQGISPLWNVFPVTELTGPSSAPSSAPAGGAFADIFQAAIENVKETDAKYNETKYLLATGQLDNPAESTLAGTQAQAAVELLIQLRNKALDAYNELMRISI